MLSKIMQSLVSIVTPSSSDDNLEDAQEAPESQQTRTSQDDPSACALSEPSEPSQITPGEKPKEQLIYAQGENPQVVVTKDDKARRAAKL